MKNFKNTITKLVLSAIAISSATSASAAYFGEKDKVEFAKKFIFNNNTINNQDNGYTTDYDNEIAQRLTKCTKVDELPDASAGSVNVAQATGSYMSLTKKQYKEYLDEINALLNEGEYVKDVIFGFNNDDFATKVNNKNIYFKKDNIFTGSIDVKISTKQPQKIWNEDEERYDYKRIERTVKLKSGVYRLIKNYNATTKTFDFTKELTKNGETVSTTKSVPVCTTASNSGSMDPTQHVGSGGFEGSNTATEKEGTVKEAASFSEGKLYNYQIVYNEKWTLAVKNEDGTYSPYNDLTVKYNADGSLATTASVNNKAQASTQSITKAATAVATTASKVKKVGNVYYVSYNGKTHTGYVIEEGDDKLFSLVDNNKYVTLKLAGNSYTVLSVVDMSYKN